MFTHINGAKTSCGYFLDPFLPLRLEYNIGDKYDHLSVNPIEF